MFGKYMQLGGFMMWPLAGCSVALLAFIFERIWTVVIRKKIFRSRKISCQELMLHRGGLKFFTDVPPALGLLGTVIGVVQSFTLADGRINAESAAAGLGVACFTTIAGLGIAIIASVTSYLLDLLAGARARASVSAKD